MPKLKEERKPFVLDSINRSSRLTTYDGLKDKYLVTFFNSRTRKKLLKKQNITTDVR